MTAGAEHSGLAPLDRESIFSSLSRKAGDQLRYLSVFEETDSTNNALLRLPEELRHGHVILAEQQTRGRGRRKRDWHSPPGGNIYMTLGWAFSPPLAFPTHLPLWVAISLAEALESLQVNAGIKWPNDIQVDGRKLAGVLVEMEGSGNQSALAVIGVGLNVLMPGDPAIDQPWTDLASCAPGDDYRDRNRVAARLVSCLLEHLAELPTRQPADLQNHWSRFDLLESREIRVEIGDEIIPGVARGIDDDGALRLERPDGRILSLHNGEVSVRHV